MTVMVALHIESITDATLIAKRQDESGQRYRASFVLTRI